MTVVGRYRGRILAWDVVNEAVSDNNGQMRTIPSGIRGSAPNISRWRSSSRARPTRTRFSITTTIRPRGRGEVRRGLQPRQRPRDQGVPIDGVGWQMHQINPFRIQQAHRTNAQRLGSLGLEVSITEMDVRISLPTTAQELSEQALAYRDLVEFCLAQPNVKTLVTWGFTDKYSWIPGFFSGFGDALIFDMNYQPKPAYTPC